jgi:hypothetical protein
MVLGNHQFRRFCCPYGYGGRIFTRPQTMVLGYSVESYVRFYIYRRADQQTQEKSGKEEFPAVASLTTSRFVNYFDSMRIARSKPLAAP